MFWKIHKEGRSPWRTLLLVALLGAGAALLWKPCLPCSILLIVAAVLWYLFRCRFYRVPEREPSCLPPDVVTAPADGEIVAIETVRDDEYLGSERLQVSVFMSIWNVHINWYPISGAIEYFRHHNGHFHVAWHPKSSTLNEHTTVVLATDSGHRVLFRQVAGFAARRIVSYASKAPAGTSVARAQECGFIKLGSRVDLLLPVGSELHVKLGDKVTGQVTAIATLPRQ